MGKMVCVTAAAVRREAAAEAHEVHGPDAGQHGRAPALRTAPPQPRRNAPAHRRPSRASAAQRAFWYVNTPFKG